MAVYVFYDTDDTGYMEYTITGDAYQAFLDTCFRYAHSVAFQLSPDYNNDLSEILPYQLPVTEKIRKMYGPAAYVYPDKEVYYTIMHFLLTPEVKAFIREETDHIFGWYYWWNDTEKNYKPDDLGFFREDESVLFSSRMHEGECYLHPKEDEDFSEILSDERWILLE